MVEKSSLSNADILARDLFPGDRDSRGVLQKRAELFAQPPKEHASLERTSRFVVMRLGAAGLYGIPHLSLATVVAVDEAVPVPGVPSHICGLTTLRGRPLALVDLARFLGGQPMSFIPGTSVVVIEHDEHRFGILVSGIEGTISYDPDSLSPPLDGEANNGFIAGIYEGKIAVLDISAICVHPGFTVNQ